jgi:hypothetical protein
MAYPVHEERVDVNPALFERLGVLRTQAMTLSAHEDMLLGQNELGARRAAELCLISLLLMLVPPCVLMNVPLWSSLCHPAHAIPFTGNHSANEQPFNPILQMCF